MGKRKESVAVWTCDNPDCPVERIEFRDGDAAEGVYLTGGQYHGTYSGGGFGPVYACSMSCLTGAVQAVIDAAG